eukprot:6321657-Amphidinium_carterae.1
MARSTSHARMLPYCTCEQYETSKYRLKPVNACSTSRYKWSGQKRDMFLQEYEGGKFSGTLYTQCAKKIV